MALRFARLYDFPENIDGGEFGSAALPGKQEEFKRNFQKTLDLAVALNCKK